MEQRHEQASLATEGGQDEGRGVQHGYGVPEDAAVADAETMDADPEAGVVEDAGTKAGPDDDDDVLIVDSVIEDEDQTESGARGAPGMADRSSPTDQAGGQRVAGVQMAPGSPHL